MCTRDGMKVTHYGIGREKGGRERRSRDERCEISARLRDEHGPVVIGGELAKCRPRCDVGFVLQMCVIGMQWKRGNKKAWAWHGQRSLSNDSDKVGNR